MTAHWQTPVLHRNRMDPMDQVIPELGLLTKCEEPVITNLERGVKSISGGDWKNTGIHFIRRLTSLSIEISRNIICQVNQIMLFLLVIARCSTDAHSSIPYIWRRALNGRCENIPDWLVYSNASAKNDFPVWSSRFLCVDMDECGLTGICDNSKCRHQ